MRNVLNARSSDGTSSYSVEFNWDGANLEIFCDCRAGALGRHCRHKEGLILGDKSILMNSSDESALEEILGWVKLSPVAIALAQYRDAEEKLKAAQAAVIAAKKLLENAIRPS